ncbi:ABC transporter ATP-binding protein [Bengtsoniella intestinalis]|uniref:energy-coupling factor ABC transporter ATP-binding protein n=1 Tax=Bengtsoniella intestinalis TaxID=3073143 RepID=UPI00391F1CCD
MEPILQLQHVSFAYDSHHHTLNDVNISFAKGEMVAVLGNNGAGKTTFFLLCNGVLTPHTGTLSLHGKPISRSKADLMTLRKCVSIVFQDPDTQLIAPTVDAEVSFGPMNLGLPSTEVVQRVDSALSTLHLQHLKSRSTHALSGGEKKQVTIADILAMEPEVILLDEPTASLDPKNAQILEDILLALNASGVTVILSTHDIDFAYGICQRAVVFSQGKILADGDIETVLSNKETIAKAGLRQPILLQIQQQIANGLDPQKLTHLRHTKELNTL